MPMVKSPLSTVTWQQSRELSEEFSSNEMILLWRIKEGQTTSRTTPVRKRQRQRSLEVKEEPDPLMKEVLRVLTQIWSLIQTALAAGRSSPWELEEDPEEKIQKRRSRREDPEEKIQKRRSRREDPEEKIQRVWTLQRQVKERRVEEDSRNGRLLVKARRLQETQTNLERGAGGVRPPH
ncbi:hypothetical protein FQA47_015206 [Oryzias melastigma]|uniref:Uncharacterized protein n=1 Tax=Oryzias melastigma TaxID=30732 RepID=A0A834CD52_ORYME|nr:hypothetical protein FQA47_015206 [Oryzias melastigma]